MVYCVINFPHMPSLFDQNMSVLREHNPLLAEELSKTIDDIGEEELKVEAAASGVLTLIYHGIYVHSRRDPEREAERLVESAAAATTTAGALDSGNPALVLGFGLGYTAAALAARFPEMPIIVVEKRPVLLKKALESRDLRAFLSRNRLVFVLGGTGEGVTGALSLFESGPGSAPLVLQNRAITAQEEDWYAAVEERIKTWNSRTNVNRATQKRFGKRWVRNLSRNFKVARDIPGISRFLEQFKDRVREMDIPVFLAAAGPTLDEAGPFLGEIYKRCIVVAVDTSLRFLLDRKIDPDFVVSVDPQYWNFRHLDRVPAPKTCLIAESAVYPPALRHCFGELFLCGSFFPLGRFIEDKVEQKGDLGTGGSVATSAWDFIRLLGARQIWIAGLDLSFPDLKTHFKGALFEEKSHAESNRFVPAETRNFRVLRNGQPFRAKGKNGDTVLTDKRLSLYASWFENRFSQFPDLENFCLSDRGLDLKGLEVATAEGLLALPCRREEINCLLKEVFASIAEGFHSDNAVKQRAEKYENARQSLLRGLEEIKNLALDAAKNAGNASTRNKMGHLDEPEREKVFKKLDAVNEAIKGSSVKEIAGFLFPETEHWETEIAEKDSNSLTRHLEFSTRFYRALAEAAAFNLQVLETGHF